MVTVGTGKVGSRFIKTKWPIEEGLELGENKLPEKIGPDVEVSAIPEKERVLR